MKKSSSSTFGFVLFILIVCFVMSPTSTKHRVLKSFETLFNLEDGSLINAYQSIKSNPSSTNTTGTSSVEHSQEAKDYFTEICLKDESGNVYDEAFKWDRDVKIYVSGTKPDYMMDQLDEIVNELNNLIDPINIEVVSDKSEANSFLYLGSSSGFNQNYPVINESKLPGNWGYFEIHTDCSYLFVDMINTAGNIEAQKSILVEEVTQSLGLCNDSWKYPNSIFYQGTSRVTEYSDLDKEIIQMLYNE